MGPASNGWVALKTASLCVDDVEIFRSIVARRLGLHFEDAKVNFLTNVLRRRLETNGCGCETYLPRLKTDPSREEIGALAQELTVGETYFFRHMDQFRAFAEVALPECLRARASRKGSDPDRPLQILSAGCASGEEAYSLAILVSETSAEASRTTSILGVDMNPVALQKALRGRFSIWSLRETPPDMQRKWFRQDGQEAVLNDAVRTRVRFDERNLLDDDAEFWQPGAYEVIFCRNVIMYFTPDNAQTLIARITRALAPGGYLFLGYAETLRGLSQDFHLQHTHGTFYYKRRESVRSHAETALPIAQRADPIPVFSTVIGRDGAWVDAIHNAAEKIRKLAQPPLGTTSASPQALGDLRHAFELLQRERFSEALDLIRELPPESTGDPDVLLLHAVLLAHSGKLAAAEQACGQLLAVDELNAGAHYVLALCREGDGDRGRAAEHDQIAVYLDPSFAMPHLHLGLVARRTGDRETARRELEQAIGLLEREEASRLLLFGGGFKRETLVALCRAELNSCGGQP